jgi:hypothetical protein
LFGIVRAGDADAALATAEAMVAAVLRTVEIALTTPGGLGVIERLGRRTGVIVGAGTVLDGVTARMAVLPAMTWSPTSPTSPLRCSVGRRPCPGCYLMGAQRLLRPGRRCRSSLPGTVAWPPTGMHTSASAGRSLTVNGDTATVVAGQAAILPAGVVRQMR